MSSQKPVFNVADWITSQHEAAAEKKPIEIYVFTDPLCPECWAMEPVLKKLLIEYGHLFSIRHVISGNLSSLNQCKSRNYDALSQLWEKTASRTGMSCDGTLWKENPISTPFAPSIGIKAAELQGRKQAIRFMRVLQEYLFLHKKDISDIHILEECAAKVGLDLDEFRKDIHSDSAARGLQCDLKITSEMDVTEIPSLVFFNQNIEEEGIKVSGLYPYGIYVSILEDMLQGLPDPNDPPDLESFLRSHTLVASREIEEVYNMTTADVEREMKKLLLRQAVEKVPAKYGSFWRYIKEKPDPE